MKFKGLLIIIYLVFTDGYSQSVSIDMSVKWEPENVSLNISGYNKFDTLVTVPFLIITYRNNMNYPVYFRALFDSDDEYPLLPYESNFGNRIDLARGLEKLYDYSSGKFNVYSLSRGYYNGMCEITPKSIAKNPDTISVINYDISRIHLVLKTQNILDKLNIKKKLSCFNFPDKETISYNQADSILSLLGYNNEQKLEFSTSDFLERGKDPTMNNRFIFLKPKETQVQKVNLIGFYIVGGSYEFCFENKAPRYVLGDSYYDNNEKKWKYKKVKLPAKINGHKLISSKIRINNTKLIIKRD